MKVILSGGTGFIGRALTWRLADRKDQVILLTRNSSAPGQAGVKREVWDAQTVGPWAESLEGADAVINFAGEPIANKRWSAAQKERILNSRVQSTRAIIEAISKRGKKPAVLVNASAVGYYGNVESGDVAEGRPKGTDFLADVCDRWEKEAMRAQEFGVRVVLLRSGIVLEKDGGALKKMLPPFQFFAGGPLGSGK